MPHEIKGREIIGIGFPPDEGAMLARELLKQDLDFDHLEVDLTGLPAALLISAFFNGFLTAISAERPEVLPKAKKISFKFDHDFQQKGAFKRVATDCSRRLASV